MNEPDNEADEDDDNDDERDNGEKVAELLKFLAAVQAANDRHSGSSIHHIGERKQEQNPYAVYKNGRLYTKINGFRFRGKTAAAACQYFLWTLIVPFALLCLAELLFGVLESGSKAVILVVFAFMLVAALLIINGIWDLIGRKLKAWSLVMKMMFYCAGILLMYTMLVKITGRSDLGTADKIIFGIILLATMLLAIRRLAAPVNNIGNTIQVKTFPFTYKGTPGTVFFRYMLVSLIIPLILVIVFWCMGGAPTGFWLFIMYLYGFAVVKSILINMWLCNLARFGEDQYTAKQKRGKKWAQFFTGQSLLLFMPELSMFLIWYFAWFPIKVWVIVLFAIYGIFWLLSTIALLAGDN